MNPPKVKLCQICLLLLVLFACSPENKETSQQQNEALPERNQDLTIEVNELIRGDSSKFIWTQARAAYIPGGGAVMTMSKKLLLGEDVYYDLYQCNLKGNQWSEPVVIPSLRIHEIEDGYRRSMSDMTPVFHAATGKVINIGKSFFYTDDKDPDRSRREVAYAYFDPKTDSWGPYKAMSVPEKNKEGKIIMSAAAGCVQYHLEEDGSILLPLSFYALTREQVERVNRETFTVQNLMKSDDVGGSVAVARCRFDGETLTFEEMGNTLTLMQGRGLGEPSIMKLNDQYYLTLRSDKSAFVSNSDDGLNFQEPKEWRFDDGSILGSYNTQQHWMRVGGQLYLIYTRPDGKNDHIFRHRAPLYIGKVDPENLVVIKDTERVCIPEGGVALGNFGVTFVNDNESWVVTTEYLRENSPGNSNRVFLAKIRAE